jgi:polyhydroxyalkanoate synthesis regulator phasin
MIFTDKIKKSFSRVKRDILAIHEWMRYTQRDVHNLKAKVFELEQRLLELEAKNIEELRTL